MQMGPSLALEKRSRQTDTTPLSDKHCVVLESHPCYRPSRHQKLHLLASFTSRNVNLGKDNETFAWQPISTRGSLFS